MTYDDLTKEDFLQSDWDKVIVESDEKECYSYSSRFGAKARELDQSGKSKEAKIFALLRDITSLHMKLDSPEEPFGPMLVLRDRRSAIIDDFDESQLGLLNQIVAYVTDAELRARIADILWLRKRDYRMAELAVSAYMESALLLEHPEHWTATTDRIERALQLATMLGRNAKFFSVVTDHIESVLTKYNGEDPLYLSAKLMELLQERKLGNSTENAARAEKLATRAESSHDWDKARTYWRIKARWHYMDKQEDKARSARILEAETYVSQAEDALNAEQPVYLIASTHLQSAMEAYRQVGNVSDRINGLHQKLLTIQQQATSQLVSHSSKTDITDMVMSAIEQVKGKELQESLIRLATINRSSSVEKLRAQAEEYRDRFLFQSLFPRVFLNAMGRVIARQPNDPKESILADMYSNASYARLVAVRGLIEPARQQIVAEHYVRINDILPFLYHNPFVLPGREPIIARGIHSGLLGDILTAVHFLIPQIEASIRYILSQLRVITSGLDDEGIQDEFNLNRLLSASEFSGPLAKTIGDDFVFDLRGLLVERFGANLRNDMAHGLIDHDTFYSDPGYYFWWLSLRFYLLPKIAIIADTESEASREPSVTDQKDA